MICVMCKKRHPYERNFQHEAKTKVQVDGILLPMCRGCALELADLAALLNEYGAGRMVEAPRKEKAG